MQSCTTLCRSQKLSLRIENYNRNEKLPFIERVLGLLVESRFRNGHAETLDAFQPRDVAEVCMDLHPKQFDIPFARKFMKFLSDMTRRATATETAAATEAASIPACQRLQTASASTFLQLANSRGP